jgi:hypothetical protein
MAAPMQGISLFFVSITLVFAEQELTSFYQGAYVTKLMFFLGFK